MTVIKLLFRLLTLLLSIICWPATNFSIYKILFGGLEWPKSRIIVEICNSILAAYRSILLILLVDKKHLIIILPIDITLYISLCRPRFIHCLIIQDWNVTIGGFAWYIWRKITKAGSKSNMALLYLNDIFIEVYNAAIRKVYTLL